MTQTSATARLSAVPLWVVPLLVLLVGGSVATNVREGSMLATTAPLLLAVVCVCAAPWRPDAALLGSGAAIAAYFAVGGADGPVYLTVPVVALIASSQRPTRRAAVLAAVAVVLMWAGLLTRLLTSDQSLEGTVWPMTGLLALTAAAVAVGAMLRERRASHAEQTRRAAAEEQLRMAQDLHDGVGHGLAVVAMQAGVALHVLDRDPAQVRASLEAIRDTSRQSLEELRGQLVRLGAGPDATPAGPRRGLDDVPQLLDRVRSGGLDVTFRGADATVPHDVGAAAYLVVQESLTNVLRHAAASRAEVRLDVADGVLLVSVIDDGRGGASADSGLGMGLPGMRARVEALGGTVSAGRRAGGFAVRAELPVGGAA
ncbi:sensor histidine kinase [Solicola sp. PLA-1-18]|uniref:sensor histidine kinase n=1 Tax=Solicola sp. PLA-1-18 TaxID=3380532 RepID=UPI003B7C6C2F